MNENDDLLKEYRTVSNENPSEDTDQFILKAAADAVESNVVQGKFSSRRWHMPVSLAAAAVITVSVVSSLKPWTTSVVEVVPVETVMDRTEQETVQEMEQKQEADRFLELKMDNKAKTSKKLARERVMAQRQKSASKVQANLGKISSDSNQLLNDLDEVDQEQLVVVTGSRIEANETPAQAEAQDELAFFAAPSAAPASVASSISEPAIEESIVADSSMTKLAFDDFSVEKWFDMIEQEIKDRHLEIAKEKIDLFLQRYEVDSLSEQQHEKFKLLKQQLKKLEE